MQFWNWQKTFVLGRNGVYIYIYIFPYIYIYICIYIYIYVWSDLTESPPTYTTDL